MFRSHGMTRECDYDGIKNFYINKYPSLNPLFTFAVPGFNFRSTEINGVLGIEQLRKIDTNIEIRSRNLKIWLSNINSKKFSSRCYSSSK